MVGLLTEFIEGDLSPEAVRDLEEHLSICPPCVDYLHSLKATRDAVAGLQEDSIPEECAALLRRVLGAGITGKDD